MSDKSLLPAAWAVPQVFRNRLGTRVGRQRPMVADGNLLMVLHAPPKPDEAERVGRFFWRSADGQWNSKEFGTGINALRKHIDEYEDLITRLDRREAQATTADDYFEIIEQLTPLLRATKNLHGVLQEARKACPEARELIDARDRVYELERNCELLFSGTKSSLDILVARRAEEQSKSSQRMAEAAHRLNILAAFFFPIATLTAIFGTNLAHGWENRYSPYLFIVVLLAGLVLGAIMTMFIARPATTAANKRAKGRHPRT